MNSGEDNDFVLEEVDRYRISVTIGSKNVTNTGNDLEQMLIVYNAIVSSVANGTSHAVISIYDYDKSTNIYHYDSDEERC